MSEEKKMITVKTSDGVTVEVEEAIAEQFGTLMQLNGEGGDTSLFPMPNVTSKILAKIVEYCEHRVSAAADDKDAVVAYDAQLEKELKEDQCTLFDLIMAANYLNIESLFNFTCQIVADMMKGKTPEEIRKIFHIKNDYTQEEEDEVRRENAWAFE